MPVDAFRTTQQRERAPHQMRRDHGPTPRCSSRQAAAWSPRRRPSRSRSGWVSFTAPPFVASVLRDVLSTSSTPGLRFGRHRHLPHDVLRGLVLAQTLEHRVAHVPLRGPAAVNAISATSFGSTQMPLRPRSSSGSFPNTGLSRRSGCSFFHRSRAVSVVVAAARAPRVAQLSILMVAEHERADRALQVRGVLVADNHELLVLSDLGLDPGVIAAGLIGRVAPLRDDAFELVRRGHARASPIRISRNDRCSGSRRPGRCLRAGVRARSCAPSA